MNKSKKPKRKYNSSRRREQARETRRQIIGAARRLIVESGYPGTTIEAIAQEAGVAPETVYAVFGNKRTILAKVIDHSVGGDDQAIPLLQRPGPQRVLQEPDPIRQLELFSKDITGILDRVTPVFLVMRAAAKAEPDIEEMSKNILEERLRNMEKFVRQLFTHSPLREGLDLKQAAEVVWTLTSPEVYGLMTIDRGWSRERYALWLSNTLARLLLP